jgi:ABC-2 type transport system permease protein
MTADPTARAASAAAPAASASAAPAGRRATSPAADHGRPPSTLSLGLARGAIELKQFFRERDALVFTFLFPALMLLLLGLIFDDLGPEGISGSQNFAASMIAAGIMSTTFVALGIGIAIDRDDGTLKRLRGLPMPKVAYFLGKAILVLVASVAEVLLLLGIGVLAFDLPLPSTVERWTTFAWVLALGVVGSTFLGIAISSVPRSARSASAVVLLPFIALQFISGVFFDPISQLPSTLIKIASVFPLKWLAQGFRSVFLPDSVAHREVAGAWEHDRVALMLALWCVGGLMLCLATFRWQSRRDR